VETCDENEDVTTIKWVVWLMV